jgi:L-ascorbate metabolism protein UlaG (beta-lactamase superfamily)
MAGICLFLLAAGGAARGEEKPGPTVAVTPLGSQEGDLCRSDRALLFEDPTGVRLLYDPGRTVNGPGDPRLGDVHVVLLSHAHGDHIGDQYVGTAACGAAANGAAFPDSNLAAIAAARKAVVIGPGELAAAATSTFLNRKIQNQRSGAVTPNCAATGVVNETDVPQAAPCVAPLRVGGSRLLRFAGAAHGVKISAVQAIHPGGIPAQLIDAASPGTSGTPGYGGEAIGLVLRFSNGLVAYLSGDTGMFGDMEAIIRRYYRPHLAVFNIGDIFSTGPDESAFAVRELLRARAVIPSHTNEASTTRGAVNPGTRLERFIAEVGDDVRVVVPLSGVTRHFDGQGRCVDCR